MLHDRQGRWTSLLSERQVLMAEYVVNCDTKTYEELVSGIKTFGFLKSEGNYQAGDVLVLQEQHSNFYSGRNVRCLITDIFESEYLPDEILVSFQLLFPESEPRIPVKVFFELFQLYNKSRRECEALKEALEK